MEEKINTENQNINNTLVNNNQVVNNVVNNIQPENANVTNNVQPEMNNVDINNVDINNKKSNKKIFIILCSIIAFIVLAIVTIIIMFNLNKKKAYDTIVNLGIDDYFKYVFTKDYEKNTNLLDINNEEQVYMYYYYNKNTKKYRIDFKDPTFEGDLYLTYAKWDEYMDYHKKVFGVESKHEMGKYDLNIDKIKLVEGDLYQRDSASPYQCSEAKNTKNCYMKLTKDTNIKGNVELTNVDIKGNTIVGTVSYDSKTENFEFTFEKNKKDYIIKTIKIVDNIE